MEKKFEIVYLPSKKKEKRSCRKDPNRNKDRQPCKNVLWKESFTAWTTSVSNRFRSPCQRSWLTKKLFSIAFASVHPVIIKTFHYYYDHIIEINWFSIYIGSTLRFQDETRSNTKKCGNWTYIKSDPSGHLPEHRRAPYQGRPQQVPCVDRAQKLLLAFRFDYHFVNTSRSALAGRRSANDKPGPHLDPEKHPKLHCITARSFLTTTMIKNT